jgi:hypothetical protein
LRLQGTNGKEADYDSRAQLGLARLLKNICMLIANFQKNIKVNGKAFHFRFYGFDTSGSGKRFLIAAHNNDEHFVFHMKLSEKGLWIISTDAPTWVNENSNKISDIIEFEMRNGSGK